MANDFLHQRHADEGSKLHALLMGAAASGIAFALHETSDRFLDWPLAVTLGAVVAWSLSFAAGVMNRRKVMQTIKSNLYRNEAEARGDQVAYDIAVEYIGKHRDSSLFFQEAQLWTLLAGALLYVGGHIWYLTERDDQRSTAPAEADPELIEMPADQLAPERSRVGTAN